MGKSYLTSSMLSTVYPAYGTSNASSRRPTRLSPNSTRMYPKRLRPLSGRSPKSMAGRSWPDCAGHAHAPISMI